MRKKGLLLAGLVLIFLAAGMLCYFRIPQMPFRGMTPEKVEEVSVSRTGTASGEERGVLSSRQQEALLSALQEVRVPRDQNVDWILYAGGYAYEIFFTLADGTEEYLIIQGDNFGHNDRNYQVSPVLCDQIEKICQETAFEKADGQGTALRSQVKSQVHTFFESCRPYGDLTAAKVASVEAVDFGGNTYGLTEQQKEEVLSQLRGLWVRRDKLGTDAVGLGDFCMFLVTLKDGSQVSVTASGPAHDRSLYAVFERDGVRFQVPKEEWFPLREVYLEILAN